METIEQLAISILEDYGVNVDEIVNDVNLSPEEKSSKLNDAVQNRFPSILASFGLPDLDGSVNLEDAHMLRHDSENPAHIKEKKGTDGKNYELKSEKHSEQGKTLYAISSIKVK